MSATDKAKNKAQSAKGKMKEAAGRPAETVPSATRERPPRSQVTSSRRGRR